MTMPRLRGWAFVFGALFVGGIILPTFLSALIDLPLPAALSRQFSVLGTVQGLTWHRLDLARVAWGPAAQETVEVGAVVVRYSPLSLLQRKILSVTLSELTLHLVKGADGFSLRGFSPPRAPQAPGAKNGAWALPLGVGSLDIQQGRLLIHDGDSAQVLPLQLHLEAVAGAPQRLRFALDLSSKQGEGRMTGEIDLAAETMAGRLTATGLALRGKKLGSLELSVRQQGLRRVQFDGWLRAVGGSKYGLRIEGEAGFDPQRQTPELACEVSLPPVDLGEIDLAKFVDLKQKLVLGGTLKGSARLRLADGSREVSAALSIRDGLLGLVEGGQEVTGINADISFPDLIGLRSETAHLAFREAKFGAQTLTSGDLVFRLQGEKGLLVERASAGWSDGTVRMRGLRLTPGSRDLELELLCEGLNIAKLFVQLGVRQFSGEGTLDGRLPIRYRDGKLSIRQGLLSSSSPGGGTIRLASAHDLITAGIPADSPQFGQLAFAAAALQDFAYDSLSIALDSQEETLLVAMKVDGRPAAALPFRYDASRGTFSRLTASGEVGIKQAVKLDVNFRLPVNTLLEYGMEIKSLWDRVQ